MAQHLSEALVEFPRDSAGEHLRSVIHYDRESYEVLYLRDDVAEAYSAGEVERVVEERRLGSMDTVRQEEMYVRGDLGCPLRCFEDGVETHLPNMTSRGRRSRSSRRLS